MFLCVVYGHIDGGHVLVKMLLCCLHELMMVTNTDVNHHIDMGLRKRQKGHANIRSVRKKACSFEQLGGDHVQICGPV